MAHPQKSGWANPRLSSIGLVALASTSDARGQGGPLSSSSASFRLRLTAAQNGLDPLTHYWFKAGGNDYRRLCDDGSWASGLRYKTPPGRECPSCRVMHLDDRRVGSRAFSLTYNLKGVFAPRLRDVKYVPDYGLGADAMKEVSVSTFARFCVSSPATRERTVLAFAGLSGDSGGFSPYGPFLALLKRAHWKTGEIDSLVDAQPNLNPMAKQYESRKTRFEELKQAYIELWRSRDASFFKVEPIGVSVGELIVRVDPEVGMRTVDGERALKLWLNAKEMPQRLSHVYHYLFGEASTDTDWPVERHLGIWDVPRLALPLPPRLPDTIEDIVVSAASDFMDRWQRLEGAR